MARALKVFSTEMGFVSAIVAAPSRKAALEAWGVRDDLFARGTAREIDDPALVEEALASPGEVIRKPIAAAADFVQKGRWPAAKKTPDRPKRKAKPPPSLEALDHAKGELRAHIEDRDGDRKKFDAEQRELDERRADADATMRNRIAKAKAAVQKAQADYDRKLEDWKG